MVMDEKGMNEVLERLYLIGLAKQFLPFRLRGFLLELGLYVRLVEDGRMIEAGGRWRTYVQARRESNEEEWQIIKFDQARWDRQFSHILQPTYEIATYLIGYANESTLNIEIDTDAFHVLFKTMDHFKNTGTWLGFQTTHKGSTCLDLRDHIERVALEITYLENVNWLSRLEKSVDSHPAGTLVQLDAVSLELQRISFARGRYKDMEKDAKRVLDIKKSRPWIPDEFHSSEHLMLGMIYLAGLSIEHRGAGIIWWGPTYSEITANDLGYDCDQLRSMSIDHLSQCLDQQYEKATRQDSGSTELNDLIAGLGNALTAARTMSREAFDEFDSYCLR